MKVRTAVELMKSTAPISFVDPLTNKLAEGSIEEVHADTGTCLVSFAKEQINALGENRSNIIVPLKSIYDGPVAEYVEPNYADLVEQISPDVDVEAALDLMDELELDEDDADLIEALFDDDDQDIPGDTLERLMGLPSLNGDVQCQLI